MAQTLALGASARQGREMLERQRAPSQRKKISDVWVWHTRGALWILTLGSVLVRDVHGSSFHYILLTIR